MKKLLSIIVATTFSFTTSALDISSADAEGWKFKSKKAKTKLKAIGINTAKPLSNYFGMGYLILLRLEDMAGYHEALKK